MGTHLAALGESIGVFIYRRLTNLRQGCLVT